jgi:hypothetical protein
MIAAIHRRPMERFYIRMKVNSGECLLFRNRLGKYDPAKKPAFPVCIPRTTEKPPHPP